MKVSTHDLSITLPVRGGEPVEAVRHASLEFAAGRVHGLIGGSGSGKTTLGQALLGLVAPTAQVSGHVEIDGRVLVPGRPGFDGVRGRRVALVPQSPAGSFTPVRRLGPQLAEVIAALRSPHTPADLLARVSLDPGVADAFPHQLSGGMAQRAAIAFALAGDPLLVVADEPTSALDPELTVQILGLLREVADAGVGVLVISHDIADLIDTGICDDLTVLRRGDVVETGAAADVLDSPRADFTRALLAALPAGGMHLTKGFEHG